MIENENEVARGVEEIDAAVGGGGDGDKWREWTSNDVKFTEYKYVLERSFRSPRDTIPMTEFGYFQLFFTSNLL